MGQPWEVHWQHDVTGYPAFYIHGLSGDQKRDQAKLDEYAKLIEQVPKLKEQRDELLAVLEDYIRVADRADDRECPAAVLANARQAIAKAKGKP